MEVRFLDQDWSIDASAVILVALMGIVAWAIWMIAREREGDE